MWKFVVLCLCSIALCEGKTLKRMRREVTQLKWSNCGNTSTHALITHAFDITPMPIVLPGNITLKMDSEITREIENMDMKVEIQKGTMFGYVSLPCVAGVGSCETKDICGALENLDSYDLPAEHVDKALTILKEAGLEAKCPIQPGRLTLPGLLAELPEMPSFLAFAIDGDYKIKIIQTESNTGIELQCLDIELAIQEYEEPCEGWFCW